MIIGTGIDIVELQRINQLLGRFGTTFIQRILHPVEQEKLPAQTIQNKQTIAFLAARFAAKEAAVKALGTGFSQGITLHSVTVESDKSGKPSLVLYGKAQEQARILGVTHMHLSLSHGKDAAVAMVILERIS